MAALSSIFLLLAVKAPTSDCREWPGRKPPHETPAPQPGGAGPKSSATAGTPQAGKRVELRGETATYLRPLRQMLNARGLDHPKSIELWLDKSERVMRLIVDGKTVKSYVVGLGGNPAARKLTRGDSATPEGDYYVCQKLPNSRFYLSLKLAYPNVADALRGLNSGLISRKTYEMIKYAIGARKIPPMNTRLGGDICIHGGGAGRLDRSGRTPAVQVRDWTAGCIALANSQMKELFHFVPLGTPVHIRA